MNESATEAVDQLVRKAGPLYTLPSVALEVLHLAEDDQIDARKLKEAIERDPALAGKVLRVVNSSLYGLRGEVTELNQAIALLGVEPLKLLVLGFSLPDRMFADLAKDQLRWFWTISLTRAVAAKAIATEWFQQEGDEAWLAGLLKDVGALVLLQELGVTYAEFLADAESSGTNLSDLEISSLGFEHAQLSANLLREWNIPEKFPLAIEQCVNAPRLGVDPGSQLSQILCLAELIAQLVGDHQIAVLPDLLERGEAYCQLARPQLDTLIEPLQTQVDQVAQAMAVELSEERDYRQALSDAHAKLAIAAEHAAAMLANRPNDDEAAERILAESHELRLAMRSFLRGCETGSKLTRPEGAHPSRNRSGAPADPARRQLANAVDKAAAKCRANREELSLLVIGPEPDANSTDLDTRLTSLLQTSQKAWGLDPLDRISLDSHLTALLAPGVDRTEAVAFAQRLIDAIDSSEEGLLSLRSGVASIALVPNRFDSKKLIDSAFRCFDSARAGAVKSIEVY